MEMADDGSQRESSITFDWTGAESVSAAVVLAMAGASGDDPTELEPLYSAVDPDALDALFRSNEDQSELSVEFRYNGRRMQISATGYGYVFGDD